MENSSEFVLCVPVPTFPFACCSNNSFFISSIRFVLCDSDVAANFVSVSLSVVCSSNNNFFISSSNSV